METIGPNRQETPSPALTTPEITPPSEQVGKLSEKEKRQMLLELWKNPETKSDLELSEVMQRDGMLCAHATFYPKKAVEQGYILPTRVINQRQGQEADTQVWRHPSAALHFSLNTAYDQETSVYVNDGGYGGSVAFFVTHPGILMTSKDASLGNAAAPTDSFQVDPQELDICFRGRSESADDPSTEFKLRAGFLLLPDGNVNPETGQPSSDMTREEYAQKVYQVDGQEKYTVKGSQKTVAAPDEYPYAIPAQEYWQAVQADLPTNERARLYFYHTRGTQGDILKEFRFMHHLPEPQPDQFAEEVNNIGFAKVTHTTQDQNTSQRSGYGTFLRLNTEISEAESSQLDPEFQVDYDTAMLAEYALQKKVLINNPLGRDAASLRENISNSREYYLWSYRKSLIAILEMNKQSEKGEPVEMERWLYSRQMAAEMKGKAAGAEKILKELEEQFPQP